MNSSQTCEGFIITHKYGVQGYSKGDKPKGAQKGILKNGGNPAVFNTRARAQGAIDRTIKYAKEHGYENEAWMGPYHIKKLKKQQD